MNPTRSFPSATGLGDIAVYAWPVEQPRGVVQIAHGMHEHAGRYEHVARYLNERGFAVVANDHCGHGHSTPGHPHGYFGKQNGWMNLVADMHTLATETHNEYPNVPFFLLGHSMGSFLARTFTALHPQLLTGAIYSGTSAGNKLAPLGRAACRLFRHDKPLTLGDKLTAGGFGKHLPPGEPSQAWISRDPDVVQAYIDDPLRGGKFTSRGYSDLMFGLTYVNRKRWYQVIPQDLPMLLIAGDQDPVGDFGRGVVRVAQKLRDTGHAYVSCIIYPDDRHEVFNELNRDEVLFDVGQWLDVVLEDDPALETIE